MKLQTSCELCTHRQDDLGCDLGKIEIFEDRDEVTVVDKDEDGNSIDNPFNIIDRVCMFRHHKDEPEREVKVPITFIILIKERDGCLDQLSSTLESIERQCPDQRIVVVYDTSIETSIADIKDLLERKLSHTNYFISALQSDNLVPGEKLDAVFGRVSNGYYCLLESGHKLRPNYYNTLYSLLYEEMNQVAAVLPRDSINEITIMCVMHKLLNGGKGEPIIQKIWNTCTEQNCEDMVYKWEEE